MEDGDNNARERPEDMSQQPNEDDEVMNLPTPPVEDPHQRETIPKDKRRRANIKRKNTKNVKDFIEEKYKVKLNKGDRPFSRV